MGELVFIITKVNFKYMIKWKIESHVKRDKWLWQKAKVKMIWMDVVLLGVGSI